MGRPSLIAPTKGQKAVQVHLRYSLSQKEFTVWFHAWEESSLNGQISCLSFLITFLFMHVISSLIVPSNHTVLTKEGRDSRKSLSSSLLRRGSYVFCPNFKGARSQWNLWVSLFHELQYGAQLKTKFHPWRHDWPWWGKVLRMEKGSRAARPTCPTAALGEDGGRGRRNGVTAAAGLSTGAPWCFVAFGLIPRRVV